MDACPCDDFASIFDRRTAEKDRERYGRDGPDRTSRMLLDLILSRGVKGASILDVGGGIGVLDHELLRAGAGHAVLVDASPDYLEIARDEAGRLDLLDRIEFVEGDFVRRAAEIDRADIVTLDRVICCYPDVVRLVGLSASSARHLYGLVLPHDRWWIRLAIRLENLWLAVRRRSYRAFAHSMALVDGLAREAGLNPIAERRTAFWRVVLFERAAG
jgi:SAM-dependent methyltransferase